MIISPQTLIAKKIAACLGSFCEVDEGMIRSRILNKSNISLKDVRVKPRVINEKGKGQAVEVIGLISEIVFRWKWGPSYISALYELLITRSLLCILLFVGRLPRCLVLVLPHFGRYPPILARVYRHGLPNREHYIILNLTQS